MNNIYRNILQQYWGYDDFRGIQREIIESIGAGHDTLGLMPTGGGKSITFQVPALSMEGVCIVVTPLISLMKDQVDHLRKLNITAYAIYSALTHNEQVKILDNCIYGDIKFLYVAPERLSSPFFQTKLRHIKVSFITVDEAHCISQWGYDFRPSYLRIADIRKLLPGKPILALTATATPEVVEDIQRQLQFTNGNVFRMSFVRDNLFYIVRQVEDVQGEIIHILNSVPGCAIVYTMSRKKTKEISQVLNAAGISASFYHAGLDNAVKSKRQNDWQQGDIRVIVATNAFGMGIDKPDVRIVIHADVPTSIESYFQEAGRGGRDGKRSYAVLLTTPRTPTILHQRLSQSYPEQDYIRDVYEHLAYFFEVGVGMGRDHTFIFSLEKFCVIYRYMPIQVDAALKILDNAGYIHYNTDQDNYSRVIFKLSRDELYKLRELTVEEDELIQVLMRLYTGLFTDYAYIDENRIAQYMQSTPERVYMLLKDLRRRHIINFVPPRTDPTITYLIDRVDGFDVKLSEAVYATRLKVMDTQVESMITYIENVDICRQRQLVRYFGEDTAKDCGSCEVCINRRKAADKDKTRQTSASARQTILNILADGKKHRITEFRRIEGFHTEDIGKAISRLIEDELITSDSLFIQMK